MKIKIDDVLNELIADFDKYEKEYHHTNDLNTIREKYRLLILTLIKDSVT